MRINNWFNGSAFTIFIFAFSEVLFPNNCFQIKNSIFLFCVAGVIFISQFIVGGDK